MTTAALLQSIRDGNLSAVDALLASGTPANGSPWRRLWKPEEPPPLHAALMADAVEIARRLLQEGADPNLETKKWMSPLAVAAQRGDLTAMRLLMEHGASAIATRTSRHPAPIEAAAWYGHDEAVALLLDRGADPDAVLGRGAESLVRISKPILARLIAAGGHAPPEIERLVRADEW